MAKLEVRILKCLMQILRKGGTGSGDFGHAGRPPLEGGSSPGAYQTRPKNADETLKDTIEEDLSNLDQLYPEDRITKLLELIPMVEHLITVGLMDERDLALVKEQIEVAESEMSECIGGICRLKPKKGKGSSKKKEKVITKDFWWNNDG